MSAPRLDDFGDVLTIADVCALLQISARSYHRMVRHGRFIDPIDGAPGVRYSKATVAAWLTRASTLRLRRSA